MIGDVWNEAYNKRKDEADTKDLIEIYEKILSSEKLQKMMIVGKNDGEESSDIHIGRKRCSVLLCYQPLSLLCRLS